MKPFKTFINPLLLYSSLHCSKELFIKTYNSISNEKKSELNMWGLISYICMKLSNDNFYKTFKSPEISEDDIIKYYDFIWDRDYAIDLPIYYGYKRIINEQSLMNINIVDSLYIYQMIDRRFPDIDKTIKIYDSHKLSITIIPKHLVYLENCFEALRDAMMTSGWYLSSYTNNNQSYELFFEPLLDKPFLGMNQFNHPDIFETINKKVSNSSN